VSRLARPAGRIATGSRIVARQLAARAAAWCARGRRDDLAGWRAALGIVARLALLGLGLYLVARLVRALPALMWVLSAGWLAAAWRAGRHRPAETEDTAPEEEPAGPDVDAVRTLLLEAMGDADAIHLRTALAHLQEKGHGRGWTVADLRARLEALGIPTQPKVKARGSKSPTRGVRRVDLASSPATAEEAPAAASTAA
jgi:hypothetical protein